MRPEHLMILGLAGCQGGNQVEEEAKLPAAQVTCVTVASSTVDNVVEVTGVIAPPPRVDAVISSPVAGRVAQVLVEEGDHVAAGALLATIEDPALPAGTIEARAQVASAKATKEAADVELTRQQRLVDTGIGARRDLDEARAKAAASAADLEAATARSGLASRQLARRELRAPHAGVVLHLWKRTGESVDGTATTPVVEVADLAVLELRAQVPPKALVAIRDAMPARVRVLGIDEPIVAKVARVAPAVDTTTLLGTVRVELAASARVPVGSAATGEIVTGSHPGLLVPANAMRRSIAGGDELVACEGSTARVRPVTVGQRAADRVEITNGVVAGDKIVVDHPLGLEDGQELVVK